MALVTFLILVVSSILHPRFISNSISYHSHFQIVLQYSLYNQISHLQTQLGILLEHIHAERSDMKELYKFSDQVLHIATSLDRLADSLSGFYSNSLKVEDNTRFNRARGKLKLKKDHSQEVLSELRNYALRKPNRLASGRNNFLGLEAINPSIGLGCARMAANLDRYMTYKVNDMCPDDWDVGQKLLVGGCDPLPRRCFSRTPPRYSKSFPLKSSLWTQPCDVNILWNHYRCKCCSCLVSNETVNRRGFYKCSNCFDLSKKRWEVQTNSTVSPEFSVDEVLGLMERAIRIGLDCSPITGTFAALMKERNITVASAKLNLGAPFNGRLLH